MDNPELSQFEMHRGLMFSIAYRMLGSASDAEDILQETYLRYQTVAPETITAPKSLLSTIVTRLCLNQLQSAHNQRSVYVGPWLPEPLLTATEEVATPAQQLELHESLSIAFLTLLEDLTPVERAVFLLREVFDYGYSEIAEMVDKDEAACRQLFRRAKKHIAEHRPRFKPTPEAHRQLLQEFVQAVGTGEMSGLMQLLADDITLWADSGGKVRGAALQPLSGREVVARFLLGSTRFSVEDFRADFDEINHEPALILRTNERTLIVLTIGIEAGLIRAIRVIGNPDKLKWINKSEKGSI